MSTQAGQMLGRAKWIAGLVGVTAAVEGELTGAADYVEDKIVAGCNKIQ